MKSISGFFGRAGKGSGFFSWQFLAILVAFLFAGLVQPSTAFAAATLVQHVSTSGQNSSTSAVTYTLSTSITASSTGNLLVAGISVKNKPTSDPAITGWTLQTSQCAATTPQTACSYVFTKLATTTSADTVTTSIVNPSGGVYSAIMTVFEYSGATNSSISFASNSGLTGQPTSGTLTPAVSSTLIFGISAQALGTAYTGTGAGTTATTPTTSGTAASWVNEFADKNTASFALNIGYFDVLSKTWCNGQFRKAYAVCGDRVSEGIRDHSRKR